jgi:hypothetical protein
MGQRYIYYLRLNSYLITIFIFVQKYKLAIIKYYHLEFLPNPKNDASLLELLFIKFLCYNGLFKVSYFSCFEKLYVSMSYAG